MTSETVTITQALPSREAITAFLAEADHHLRESERYREFRHGEASATEKLLGSALNIINALDNTRIESSPIPLTDIREEVGVRERIEWVTSQYHDANEWAVESDPDGKGNLLDWICRASNPLPRGSGASDELVERVARALRQMVYETTHLSPMRSDGSHECRISAMALADARAVLSELSEGKTPCSTGAADAGEPCSDAPAKKVATSREIMLAGGVDPDAPFEVGPFPSDMRQAPEPSDTKALVDALEGMLEIAECWAIIDGGKNIDLDASEAVGAARAALAQHRRAS